MFALNRSRRGLKCVGPSKSSNPRNHPGYITPEAIATGKPTHKPKEPHTYHIISRRSQVRSSPASQCISHFPFPFGLLALGLIGNHRTSFRILVANTRYASSASSLVSNVLSLFIHIFRYLSDPVSFSAAYHSPLDRCFSTMARRRPPRPVTPETCLRHADLSEERGSSVSSIGESTRLGGE